VRKYEYENVCEKKNVYLSQNSKLVYSIGYLVPKHAWKEGVWEHLA
jgi:hypothetical protein